ncbi:MAG: prephenate dehydrogenase [Candidatus Methylacidiphilales bacterium]|nr:prephenate dehydrogenase/arogenate dehydrogenase family protein [Candidatus Methylacidiphilales bacterium]
MFYRKVAILGPGLLGGSLALALTERGLAREISIYGRSEKSLAPVRERGLPYTLTTDPAAAVEDAEVVVLCVPIGAMGALAKAIMPRLSPFALVTDVGSVKGPVVDEIGTILRGVAIWIGSHPMAGSEQSGFNAASARLFQGATTILTPEADTPEATIEAARSLWEAVGSRVTMLDPYTHDKLVAEVSHLPHLIAAALATLPSEAGLPLVGNGFRDTTRIASGPPDMWTEILETNRTAILAALDTFIARLAQTRTALLTHDTQTLKNLLIEANHIRAKLGPATPRSG